MIRLIADSGSTKTDWALVTDSTTLNIATQGINPIHQDDDTINNIITHELCNQLNGTQPTHIHFYGAGCVGGTINAHLHDILSRHFIDAHIEIESDLLGAARSLCGHKEGIAGILGTGANSCFYDGHKIIANTPPLGYILGDEGSGASLGKAFIQALLRGNLGSALLDEFYAQYNTDYRTLITRIYREPAANRYLASISPFIADHLHISEVRHIVSNVMATFIDNHIAPYNRIDCPINLVGSIAYYYRDIITEVAQNKGYTTGTIDRSPIDNLISYHTHN